LDQFDLRMSGLFDGITNFATKSRKQKQRGPLIQSFKTNQNHKLGIILD